MKRGATGDVEPQKGGLRAVHPAGMQGGRAPVGSLGVKPQKLKPKNTLEAPRKALW